MKPQFLVLEVLRTLSSHTLFFFFFFGTYTLALPLCRSIKLSSMFFQTIHPRVQALTANKEDSFPNMIEIKVPIDDIPETK